MRESGTIHPVPPNPIPQLQVLVLQVVTVRPASKRRLLDSHGSLAKTVLSEHGGANVSTARSFLCGGTSHSNLFGLVQVIRYTGRQASKQHLLHRTLSKHAKFRKFGFGVEDIGSFPENEHAEHAQSRARLWLLHDMCESTCRC